ncbi:hypothetical protein EI94DRAFT_1698083 [Lactarius quietus]|nr:hypothetical protein EI94DRAFT_1698083 [Lactarius quietus]
MCKQDAQMWDKPAPLFTCNRVHSAEEEQLHVQLGMSRHECTNLEKHRRVIEHKGKCYINKMRYFAQGLVVLLLALKPDSHGRSTVLEIATGVLGKDLLKHDDAL